MAEADADADVSFGNGRYGGYGHGRGFHFTEKGETEPGAAEASTEVYVEPFPVIWLSPEVEPDDSWPFGYGRGHGN